MGPERGWRWLLAALVVSVAVGVWAVEYTRDGQRPWSLREGEVGGVYRDRVVIGQRDRGGKWHAQWVRAPQAVLDTIRAGQWCEAGSWQTSTMLYPDGVTAQLRPGWQLAPWAFERRW